MFLYKSSSYIFAQRAGAVLKEAGIQCRVDETIVPSTNAGYMTHGGEWSIHIADPQDFDAAKKMLISIGAYDPAPVRLPSKATTNAIIVLILLCLSLWLLAFSNNR